LTTDDVAAGIRRHISEFWPDSPQQEFSRTLGPIAERLPRFRVRRVQPMQPTDPWVYLTVGAWEATDADRAEFFILSPGETPRHVETARAAPSRGVPQLLSANTGQTTDRRLGSRTSL
jgi:hypothetical protein